MTYGMADLVIRQRQVYRPKLYLIDRTSTPYQTTVRAGVAGSTFDLEAYILLEVKKWEPYKQYSKDTIVVYDNKPYVALTDFTSGRYFNYDSTVTVSNSITWEANVKYSVGDIISYAGGTYRVLNTFTSDVVFNDTQVTRILDLSAYPGGYFDDAASRVWAYYAPVAGMPGRDLAQVMSGIEYPGVNVTGQDFDQVGGYGFGRYEQIAYDTRTFDENGLLEVLGDQVLDNKLYSFYKDSQLGLRPEDMITDGAAYVDTNSSHAPEELIPGHMFDSLDMQVRTLSSRDKANAPEFVVVTYYADNFTKRFSFDPAITRTPLPADGVEAVFVFSDYEGMFIEGVDYTVTWQDQPG